jgi:NAD-dependent dihydropyrimidine dehydrogenase PreA subunit
MLLLLIPPIVLALLAVLWLVGERGHLALPSTRAALRARRADGGPGGGLLPALHGYVYGRWSEAYIRLFRRVAPWMGPRAKQAWADRYHGKVLPTELACRIIRLDHPIRRDLDQIIPYPRARTLLLSGSPQVTLLECPCRLGRPAHCEPTQVCMLVGGGDFALDHHPTKARRVSQEEALALLQAEHERGHVHTAYFKDAVADRFYAICNCCKCCCGGLEAMTRHGVPMVASSGFVAEVDEGACIGCGDCEDACPFGAIHVPYRAEVTWDSCMGCGVCEGRCVTGAIALVRDQRKGIPLDVGALV